MKRQAILVADMGYGDAGKGSLVDYLTRDLGARTVIRYNGGAQAAHNVITPSGLHHTFAQFGSGMFVPGVRTHLSRFMLVDPLSMLREERHLRDLGIGDAFSRTTIDREALVITPYHQALNRLREMARGTERHGSCGMGIGETMADSVAHRARVPLMGDLQHPMRLKEKLAFTRELKLAPVQEIRDLLPDTEPVRRELEVLQDPEMLNFIAEIYAQFADQVEIVEPTFLGRLLDEGTVIGEGAQGVLLDEWYGFHPYTTWSTTTFRNAERLLEEQDYDGPVKRIGVLRAYATRHGPGPFVTEDSRLTAALPDLHNCANSWQLGWRVGYFDAVASRYALAVAGQVDFLAITHLDRLGEIEEWKIASGYEYRGQLDHLDDFFASRNGLLTNIRVGGPQDLERQGQLALRLKECIPHYDVCSTNETSAAPQANVSAFLGRVEDELGVPIGILSKGPTALDKCWTIPSLA